MDAKQRDEIRKLVNKEVQDVLRGEIAQWRAEVATQGPSGQAAAAETFSSQAGAGRYRRAPTRPLGGNKGPHSQQAAPQMAGAAQQAAQTGSQMIGPEQGAQAPEGSGMSGMIGPTQPAVPAVGMAPGMMAGGYPAGQVGTPGLQPGAASGGNAGEQAPQAMSQLTGAGQGAAAEMGQPITEVPMPPGLHAEYVKSIAHLLAQAQFELSQELSANLQRLKDVIAESQDLARKIESILGKGSERGG